MQKDKLPHFLILRSSLLRNFPINILQYIRRNLGLLEIEHALRMLHRLEAERMRATLLKEPKYSHPLRLARYEFQSFSQGGEDGVLREIFHRLGIESGFFVEFGVESGIETNSTFLLLQGWRGLWFEGNPKHLAKLKQRFISLIKSGTLNVKQAWLTPENVADLLSTEGVQPGFDFLSIDVDSRDYWMLRAILPMRPKVICIEYNAQFPPGIYWSVAESDNQSWGLDSHMGASLSSIEKLAKQAGYSLVHCTLAGLNAFFVRDDLLGDKFATALSVEDLFEPLRYSLLIKEGHQREFRPFASPGLDK